uniref:C-type lectin domain-containing protein n=1 Tax=Panagrolaimus sp. PS1159 TaxID=55785 RepID=A0AC35F6G6_9BILA
MANGYINGTCWILSQLSLNFQDAEKFCQSNNGHLASIHDALSNSQLTASALGAFNGAEFFVGGSYVQNKWTWSDGTAFDFTDWATNEPNSHSTCISISVSSGLWYSYDCSAPLRFACLTNAISISDTFTNPIHSPGPDPWILKHENMYYFTHTTGVNVVLYKTYDITQVQSVQPVIIWTPPSSGLYSQQIWAPEIHFIDGKFYVYFTADDGNNDNHRIYCIENSAADPTTGQWIFKGKVGDPANHWAIDVSTFEFQGQRYMIWSGWKDYVNVAQQIYIAKMLNPWTLDGDRVMLSEPIYDWEKVGGPPTINEGPEALISPSGQLFLTYSASVCWVDNYALGLLTLKVGGNPLNSGDWSKSNIPVFSQNLGAYGPGHNGFFKSPDGTEDWIVYHANPQPGQGCGDIRSARIQKIGWNEDGTPFLGIPTPINVAIKKPMGL